jgi:hypothetical protein
MLEVFMRAHGLAILWLALVTYPAMAQRSGRITGTILDDNGQLLQDARVCLMMRSGNSTAITCNLGRTDGSGQFEIKNLESGVYGVFAAKEEEGFSIDNQQPGEKVELSAQNPTADVTVHSRRRGGVLIGTVTDRLTGQPLNSAWINYEDIDGKAAGSSTIVDGQIRMALPTECDLVIIVSSKGYRGWVFTDPANPTRPVLRVHSGERKTLNIQLDPTTDAHQ